MNKKINKTTHTNFIMGELEYKKAIWKIALPSITSFIVISLYITVDRFMISNFVGGEGLAAIQYFQPALALLIALLVAIGTGTKTLLSILYGANNESQAQETLAVGFLITTILSFFVAIAMFLLGPFIPVWFGAEEAIAQMAKIYFLFFAFGVIPQAFVYYCESICTAKGYTKIILLFTIISQLLNLSLDYVLMAIFDWGISGAAFATVFSMFASFVFYLIYIGWFKKEFLINPFKYKLFSKTAKKIIKIGFPSSISQVIIAFKFILVTFLLTSFNDIQLIIVYSATMAVLHTFFIPFFGFATATVPIMGYSFGSKKYKRLEKVWKYKVKVSVFYFIFFVLLMWIFPRFFLGIFNAGHYQYSEILPRIITFGLWVLPISISYGFLFQSVGNVKESLYVNIVRNVFVFVPIIFIFRLFNDPILLIYAFPVSDFLGAVLIFILVKTRYWKKMHNDLKKSWKKPLK